MSTLKKIVLLTALERSATEDVKRRQTAANWINKLWDEYFKKEGTAVTADVVQSLGYIFCEADSNEVLQVYRKDDMPTIYFSKVSRTWSIHTDCYFANVAELEDVLEACGIETDINIDPFIFLDIV